jgi:dTDP-4-amino-4,6-dideoxygalactose transaminase
MLNAPGSAALRDRAALLAAAARVIDSGQLILGQEVATFEHAFAAACGVAHAVGVGNGTDAIELALRALDIGPGAMVIVPAHTAGASARAVLRAGATPLLVDIEPARFALDPRAVERALAQHPSIRAVLLVHLYGHPAQVTPIAALCQARRVALIEDCAQAFGAALDGVPVGRFGAAAAHSFYPTKTLAALGDGGAVTCDDPALADRLRRLREYGWRERQNAESFGINSRLDELQAAFLNERLARFAADLSRRGALAARYDERLRELAVVRPTVANGAIHAWHLYVVRCAHRDALRAWLAERGLPLQVHYAHALHRQLGYADAQVFETLDESERAANEVLSLPMHAGMTDADVDRVVALLAAGLDATA